MNVTVGTVVKDESTSNLITDRRLIKSRHRCVIFYVKQMTSGNGPLNAFYGRDRG
jgi:hypothetical protein